MTPAYINDRGLTPVYDMGAELYMGLHGLSLIEGEVVEGATSWLEST